MALEEQLRDFERALSRLKEAFSRASEDTTGDDYYFFRDSAIQRFEFTVEIFWKTVKRYLGFKEGIDCRTPKSCIREFFSAGFIDEDTTVKLLEMIDDRNLTSHAYKEEVAEGIFSRLEGYINIINILEKVLGRLM